jgi:threonine dehydratase
VKVFVAVAVTHSSSSAERLLAGGFRTQHESRDDGCVITHEDIGAAAKRIAGRVRRTPVVEIAPRLWLKLELVQHTGSFKPRGMFNRVLANDVPAAGLTVASGGNAGLAVAYVGRELGHPVEVFVPETTPRLKADRLRDYGAHVTAVGETYADALVASQARADESGALFVHAYDQPEVVAGQGTLARELALQVSDAQTILVSVGGGGLIGGIAAWYADTPTRVIAVEPVGCPTLHAARAAGAPVDVQTEGIARDSLGARRIGAIAWALSEAGHIDGSLLVDDGAIAEARRWLWREARMAVEPGAATAMAALLNGAYQPKQDETVVVVICGANADPADL